ncbi:MAG: hypothetical protein DRJ52_08355 [Thermoprotei archaeon]|nr:MAG: hypothetical protein DRJ52_08355 [Thermoprotei archaeon]
MNELLNKIKEYREAVRKAKQLGEEIARTIAEAVKPVIPDIKYSVGWAEAGVDTLCFYSDSMDVTKRGRYLAEEFAKSKKSLHDALREAAEKFAEKYVYFEDVVTEIFPKLKGYIDCPYGIHLTYSEAEEVRKLLKQLRGDGE